MEITEPYLSAASYTGTECKYTEVYGIDTEFGIGGGEQEFTFRRSAQVRVTALVGCLTAVGTCEC